MSKYRKPIPPPTSLVPPVEATMDELYKLPFVIAEGPRMMLNFLAMSSNLPQAYRNMISQWLLGYNEVLVEYIGTNYGGDEAIKHADLVAKAMFTGFIEAIREERESADSEMFSNLDREIFGGNEFPDTAGQ